jgi:hypothetical protein
LKNLNIEYQTLVDRLEYLETMAGVRQGLVELAEGKAFPAVPALEELRSRLQKKG